jgi:Uma2 family endonuclease
MSAHLESLLTNADLEGFPQDGNRYELIGGVLYVSTAPDLIHQRAAGRIYIAFDKYLEQEPIGEILLGPGVILSDYDGVIPDLVYLSNERRDEIATGARIYGAPNLVVEILSPGKQNMERDRKKKLTLYAKFGVEEYWIVDTRERAVEVFRREGETLKLFTTNIIDETLTSPLLPGFEPSVNSFFEHATED